MNTDNGYFGEYGGQYVPQILMPALVQLESTFKHAIQDPDFISELTGLLEDYAGRPTALTLCRNLTKGSKTKLYLKREDLLHGGVHVMNQVLGQVLLAIRMGKTAIIAETGAGQHGVATAMACSLWNLKCRIYMGYKDLESQQTNVLRMKLMGATVVPVSSGSGTLKDACNEAIRDWSENCSTAHYLIGTSAGPHPYPSLVQEFQKIIGEETKKQIMLKEGRLPDAVIACIGGGSNAIGIFTDFIDESSVRLIGVEPAGSGQDSNMHSAPLINGKTGVFFGMKAPLLQNHEGQITVSHSISAGLNFPSVGPQHAYLRDINRAEYVAITDNEAVKAFNSLASHEGIIPALESAHALAYALKLIAQEPQSENIFVVNISGRGDKDISTVQNHLNTGVES